MIKKIRSKINFDARVKNDHEIFSEIKINFCCNFFTREKIYGKDDKICVQQIFNFQMKRSLEVEAKYLRQFHFKKAYLQ